MTSLLLDLDGTVRSPTFGEAPVPPPRALGRAFRHLSRQHILCAATGASLDSVRITEGHLKLRFAMVAASYCARLVRRGGVTPSELYLVPRVQQSEMGQLTPSLDRIREACRGKLDDRGVVYTMFLPVESQAFTNAQAQVAELVGTNPHVRFMANAHDGGITVMPADGGKVLITRYIREQVGHTVLIGAGDTGSDLPLLEASAFPIITRTTVGATIHPALLEHVQRRGVGYVAKEDEPHAHGLLAGLQAARAAGVVQF